MAANTPVRPLVPTAIRTEFGDVLDNEDLRSGQHDLTYVPGFSDMRLQRDLQLAEVAQGRRKLSDVRTLPVRCQLVRTTKQTGEPDQMKPVSYSLQGYKPATEADIGKEWLTALPPAARIVGGGEIRIGDCTLMVTDAKTAARNAAGVRVATERMSKHAAVNDLMSLGATRQGSDPTFEAEPGRTIKAPSSAIKA